MNCGEVGSLDNLEVAKRAVGSQTQYGFSDRQLATIFSTTELKGPGGTTQVGARDRGDPCSRASTPAPPSSKPTRRTITARMSWKTNCRQSSDKKRVVILGGGPNRIGQGIEFDYCCCHASFALREIGYRIDHGQQQSGNGQHRLRHLRHSVLRTADDRRRVEHLRCDTARRSDRAIRRPNAA